ncbi:hypothetical protein D7X30_04220 [Corallococcus sp. AB011P]|uniref:hypothetical protein n=1 Tax=unclassified Corallococcus TaxID=2685029 RepID=UPI000EA264BF|nr:MULTISPECIES: hypothetical protein [unclassified Corallococcus]RKG62500.1 hypothetical protein D7X30_04220 [Corallococcus sp. AB011P]RKH91356.1 hypothetical protein D7Y21_03025 [Corallococcus sp. AB045]
MTVDEKLNELGMAWIRIYKAVNLLADRIDDADVTEGERAMIALRFPTLRADRDAIQARIVALTANASELGLVSDDAFQQMKSVVAQLQSVTKQQALVTQLLNVATDAAAAARSITG